MRRNRTWIVVLCLSILAVIASVPTRGGADDEKYADKEYTKALEYANAGFDELDKMDNDLAKEEPKKAVEHFEVAIDMFKDALTHLEKSEVGKEHAGAIDELNKGNDELSKALKFLEAGKVDDAQQAFDKASQYYDSAQTALN